MKCKSCQSENLHVRKNGPHYELFCGDCLVFQKFINKKATARFEAVEREKDDRSHNQVK